jgi:hypothetical protein
MMPWQRKGARLLSELSDEMCRCHVPALPLPRYKTVITTVPRQQGKTVLSRASIKTKAEQAPRYGDPFEMYGTAQSRQYAAKHVVKLGETLKRRGDPVKLLRGVGAESVTWPDGTYYLPISPTEGGGHGDSIDFLLIDEGWALTAVTLGGVAPALIARPHSQTLIISTMGTLESEAWNGIVAEGRDAVAAQKAGHQTRMAYIEYSAPSDEAVFVEEMWGTWMPALGLTVQTEDIRAAMALMEAAEGRGEVVRAFGNRTTAGMVTLFPAEWIERAWRDIDPADRIVVALDVNEEPMGATVTTGHITQESLGAVRTVENRAGSPSWVPSFIEQMTTQRKVEAVVGDFGGPARVIKTEIEAMCEARGVHFMDRLPRDLGADTLRFYNALKDSEVILNRERDPNPLQTALHGARKKDLGDLWVVNRRPMAVDASPAFAAIMAYGVAVELNVRPEIQVFIYNPG